MTGAAPQLPLGDTTGEDLACAVQVLAAEADRARRLVGLWRGESHRLWAERVERAHAAVVGLQALAAVKAPDDIDALLLEVADAGVGRLVLECRPSRSRSLYVATWTQEGRRVVREARSVGAVLRRVVRAAGAVSGAPGRKGQAA